MLPATPSLHATAFMWRWRALCGVSQLLESFWVAVTHATVYFPSATCKHLLTTIPAVPEPVIMFLRHGPTRCFQHQRAHPSPDTSSCWHFILNVPVSMTMVVANWYVWWIKELFLFTEVDCLLSQTHTQSKAPRLSDNLPQARLRPNFRGGVGGRMGKGVGGEREGGGQMEVIMHQKWKYCVVVVCSPEGGDLVGSKVSL